MELWEPSALDNLFSQKIKKKALGNNKKMDIDWQLLNRVQFTEADQVRAITLQHNLNKVVMKHRKEAVHEHTFNCKVKDFVATNQENSGRCWIFAGLNLMRSCMARKYHLPDTFELSQPFVFFFRQA